MVRFVDNFDRYESLISNRGDCFPITLFFRRIIHLIKEGEWITDTVMLKRFRASIKGPSESNARIYKIFRKKLGYNSLLDEIKAMISTSEMKITHSRFSLDLWDYVRFRGELSTYFPNHFLTEEGINLDQTLKTELDNRLVACKNDKSNKPDLLNFMLRVEEREREAFKSFLEIVLEKIRSKGFSEELKNDVRKIRKYLMNRRPRLTKTGMHEQTEVFYDLARLLMPTYQPPEILYSRPDTLTAQNGRLYITVETPNGVRKDFAAGFSISQNAHSRVYLFNGQNYTCLDNLSHAKEISAESLKDKIHLSPVQIAFINPDSIINNDFSAWSLPEWERNNCFLVSSLLLISYMKCTSVL